jgi:hypothetical protein
MAWHGMENGWMDVFFLQNLDREACSFRFSSSDSALSRMHPPSRDASPIHIQLAASASPCYADRRVSAVLAYDAQNMLLTQLRKTRESIEQCRCLMQLRSVPLDFCSLSVNAFSGFFFTIYTSAVDLYTTIDASSTGMNQYHCFFADIPPSSRISADWGHHRQHNPSGKKGPTSDSHHSSRGEEKSRGSRGSSS